MAVSLGKHTKYIFTFNYHVPPYMNGHSRPPVLTPLPEILMDLIFGGFLDFL